METLPILALASTAVGGALVGASACYWPLQRAIARLRERLERTEQARNGAVERSAQAREQISQLNRAITELRRAHSTHSTRGAPAATPSPQQLAEAALAAGDEKTIILPRREAPQAFADT
ncbi:MAG: hypothetical protein ABIQ29_00910, partial [Burkholderiaceae bacterium]